MNSNFYFSLVFFYFNFIFIFLFFFEESLNKKVKFSRKKFYFKGGDVVEGAFALTDLFKRPNYV